MLAGLIVEGNDGGSGRSVRVKSMGSYSEPNLVLTWLPSGNNSVVIGFSHAEFDSLYLPTAANLATLSAPSTFLPLPILHVSNQQIQV